MQCIRQSLYKREILKNKWEPLFVFFFPQTDVTVFSDCSGMLIVVLTEYCPADIQSDSHFLSAQFSTVLANKVYSSFSSFVRITFLNAFITFLNIIQIQYSRSAAGCILHLSEFEISYNETKFWSHIWKFSLKRNVFSSKTPIIAQKNMMSELAMLSTSCWFHGISMTQPLCQGRTQRHRLSNNIRTQLKTHNYKVTIEVQWLDRRDGRIFALLKSSRFLSRLWKIP